MRIPALVRVIILFTAVAALGVAAFLFISQQRPAESGKRPLSIGAAAAGAAAGAREPVGITVQGQGEVKLKPDTAFVSVGVEQIAPTAAEASAALSRISAAVLAGLKGLKIEDKDIATQNLSLTPIYEESGERGTAARKIEGYRASTSVLVTVRQVGQASTVLDAAIEAGANVVNFVRFGVSNPEALKREALDAATRDAALKAEAMAKALGGKLGGLIWMQEESFVFAQAERAIAVEGMAAGRGQFGPPVEAGELTVTATVRANFAYE